ncbi:MAG: type ISP restriction/modification enzyme [Bacteroidota bacterium]|nr:type ISP restriction/modification enzyme [Bacteroidota bacterium]
MLKNYLENLQHTINKGNAREESFYKHLEKLLLDFAVANKIKNVDITILPKKTDAGNPDFRVWDGKNHITGYIEAKEPSVENLSYIEDTGQLQRYLNTFPNIILTNFYEFRLYRDGELIAKTSIGRSKIARKLQTAPPVENENEFYDLLNLFFSFSLPKINSAKTLAVELAKRTRFLKDEVVSIELEEEEKTGRKTILGFYEAFKKYLIGTLTKEQFADLYSQTLTYGLFAARTRANSDFNRELAFKFIPNTIGILKDVFRFISLGDPPKSLQIIIEDITEVLKVTDVKKILHDYYTEGKGKDPIIHFYETFLTAYDPSIREKRGVYYTPEPVVGYIVRSINQILKTHFDLYDGLANENVTLLDPAGGTLTFPAEAIKIAVEEYSSNYGEGGVDGQLLRGQILQNFYAFELMMAPYAIGHLKMGFLFEELGYPLKNDERFKLYLTNTLETEDLEQISIPGLSSLSEESHLAAEVKKNQPVLVILGNPPYSGISSNINDWTEKLLKEDLDGALSYYKVDDKPLGEKKLWLQDDYVKFLRFAQWKIHKAGFGIVGMITNHSYLDNPTFRGMRQSLMNTFNEIYILDLHGNSNKKEITPDLPAPRSGSFWVYVLKCKDESFYIGQTDNIRRRFDEHLKGEVSWTKSRLPIKIIHLEELSSREESVSRESNLKTGFGRKWLKREYEAGRLMARQAGGGKDENVFDIRQGVAIALFIKKKSIIVRGIIPLKTPAKVFHSELFGLREVKYKWLSKYTLKAKLYNRLKPGSPWYFFIPRDTDKIKGYLEWDKINKIFPVNVTGIVTARDSFVIGVEKKEIENRIRQFRNLSISDEIIEKTFKLKDTRGWKLKEARFDLSKDNDWDTYWQKILYRPFDVRDIYYTPKMVDWGRPEYMDQMLKENISLCFMRQFSGDMPYTHFLVSEHMVDNRTFFSSKGIIQQAPLYLYPKLIEPKKKAFMQLMIFEPEAPYKPHKQPNISEEIFAKLKKAYRKEPKPEDLFYYVYGIFYSNKYREKYAEFLKIDFPRVPFTKNYKLFKQIAQLGEELAGLHLMKSKILDRATIGYQGIGDNKIEFVKYNEEENRIYINAEKYFSGITPNLWNYHIGGYQVLSKFLKDRKGRRLDDSKFYGKIVTAIAKTIELQKQIDKIYNKVESSLIK